MPEDQANRVLRQVGERRCAFSEILPFEAQDVKLASVRTSLRGIFAEEVVEDLLVPQLWSPKFLMLEVVCCLLADLPSDVFQQRVASVARLWDYWAGLRMDLLSDDEKDEEGDESGDAFDDDFFEVDNGMTTFLTG